MPDRAKMNLDHTVWIVFMLYVVQPVSICNLEFCSLCIYLSRPSSLYSIASDLGSHPGVVKHLLQRWP